MFARFREIHKADRLQVDTYYIRIDTNRADLARIDRATRRTGVYNLDLTPIPLDAVFDLVTNNPDHWLVNKIVLPRKLSLAGDDPFFRGKCFKVVEQVKLVHWFQAIMRLEDL